MLRVLTSVLACATAGALGACDREATGAYDTRPAAMQVVSGDAQEAMAGTELPQEVGVRVTNARGEPLRGKVVTFQATSGGGAVRWGWAHTDAEGIARERWTLGTVTRLPQVLQVAVMERGTGKRLMEVSISARARPGPAARVEALHRDTVVSGVIGTRIGDTLAVVVSDSLGNGVPGQAVDWSVLAGSGEVAALEAVTDSFGIARATWTLPSEPQPQYRARAVAPDVGDVVFSGLVATELRSGRAPWTYGSSGIPGMVRKEQVAAWGVPGLEVHWSASHGGRVHAPVTRTDERGVAEVEWELGSTLGTQTLTARVGPLGQALTARVLKPATFTVLAELPGTVVDTDGARVLWVRPSDHAIVLRLPSGADVPLPFFGARLFPGGVVGVLGDSVMEYRDGSVSRVGPVTGSVVVKGTWAAWLASAAGPVVRRNLAAGTSMLIQPTRSDAKLYALDLGPNGDVVYLDSLGGGDQRLYRYRAGTITELDRPAPASDPQTDGVNVVYSAQGHELFYRPWEWYTHVLTPHGRERLDGRAAGVSGGWVATVGYTFRSRMDPQPYPAGIGLRSPAGEKVYVDIPGYVHAFVALGPDGSVVYTAADVSTLDSHLANVRMYVNAPGGPPSDLGPDSLGGRFVYADGRFLLMREGTVFEVSP